MASIENRALMRLQVVVTAVIHQIFADFTAKTVKLVTDQAGVNGLLDANEVLPASRLIRAEWDKAMKKYNTVLFNALENAVALPWATMARNHFDFFGPQPYKRQRVKEALPSAVGPIAFTPELRAFIDQQKNKVYPDGLNLSARIWKLDTQSIAGIEKILFNSVGKNAWEAAKELEQYLGANANCPRWTRARLAKVSKQAIADGSQEGLIRQTDNSPCSAKGVSYNALRLARNEIQTIHHAMNDYLLSQQPFVEKEQILLSKQHPNIGCECEKVVTGGENGEGIYPLGTISLPIHVQCLCYKVAVMEDVDEFLEKLDKWQGDDPQEQADVLTALEPELDIQLPAAPPIPATIATLPLKQAPAGQPSFSVTLRTNRPGLAMTGAFPKIDSYMAYLGITPPAVDNGESWELGWRKLLAISAVFLFWLFGDTDDLFNALEG